MAAIKSEAEQLSATQAQSTLMRCIKIAWPVSLQSVLAAALGMIDIIR